MRAESIALVELSNQAPSAGDKILQRKCWLAIFVEAKGIILSIFLDHRPIDGGVLHVLHVVHVRGIKKKIKFCIESRLFCHKNKPACSRHSSRVSFAN